MNPLQLITLGVGVVGTILTQIVPMLPEGPVKAKLGLASVFLSGLAINVFKRKS